jgi:regulatory protein
MIKKPPLQPEDVHVSAAVDLGSIVLQAAGALRKNRGIARATPPQPDAVGASTRKAVSPDDTTQRRTQKPWQKSAPDPEKLTAQHAYLRAIALLTGRDYSQKKITEKLAKFCFAPDAISEALLRLVREGSLSDVRFAASRTNGLINRGKGPRAIRAKLYEAGVAKELISNTLGELEIDWGARAKELLLRKFGPEPPPDRLSWAKRARFLAARGFDESAVRSALAKVTR